jgi:aconitate hydratase
VAYAIAGSMQVDLYNEPLGTDDRGNEVYLKDIWPTAAEVAELIEEAVQSDMFHKSYGEVFDGDERWNGLEVPTGDLFEWDERSTYVRRPPFFEDLPREPEPLEDIKDARVLAVLGDSVTTDHISPAGSIKPGGPAAQYLNANHVEAADFNSYGSRRGNHEVMMRGTFANIRLRNRLAPGTEGGVTLYLADGSDEERASR